jgi:hypothetical protein
VKIILPGLNDAPAVNQQDAGWRCVMKRTDELRVANTSQNDDIDLWLPVEADCGYAVKAYLYFDAGSATLTALWSMPPGATFRAFHRGVRTGFDVQFPYLTDAAATMTVTPLQAQSPMQQLTRGVLRTTRAGRFGLRWTQFSGGVANKLRPGSCLCMRRCG